MNTLTSPVLVHPLRAVFLSALSTSLIYTVILQVRMGLRCHVAVPHLLSTAP